LRVFGHIVIGESDRSAKPIAATHYLPGIGELLKERQHVGNHHRLARLPRCLHQAMGVR